MKPPAKQRDKLITVRLSEYELELLDTWIGQCSSSGTTRSKPLTRSGLIRLLIRDCVGLDPNFLPNEQEFIYLMNTALTRLGANFNQAVKLMHQGRGGDVKFSFVQLNQVEAICKKLKEALRHLLRHSERRSQIAFNYLKIKHIHDSD